jgi:hypothetical protein
MNLHNPITAHQMLQTLMTLLKQTIVSMTTMTSQMVQCHHQIVVIMIFQTLYTTTQQNILSAGRGEILVLGLHLQELPGGCFPLKIDGNKMFASVK